MKELAGQYEYIDIYNEYEEHKVPFSFQRVRRVAIRIIKNNNVFGKKLGYYYENIESRFCLKGKQTRDLYKV